jgi:FkbM family methyltransferase
MIKASIQSCLAMVGVRLSRIRPPGQVFPAINVLQLAVDDAVRRHLSSGRSLDTFWCVQIGAHDGVSYDPVRQYITGYPFPALLIEPQPDIFASLRENYCGFDNVILENVAVAYQEGIIPLYRYRAGPNTSYDASTLSSLSREVLERNLHRVSADIEEIRVVACTLSGLLNKHAIPNIGLLQIDTEGFDFEIIKMIDFTKYKPTIINFEDGFLSRAERSACLSLLCGHGYRVSKNGLDVVAYQQEKEGSSFGARSIVTALEGDGQ